jgi:hypothetical protein
MSPIQHLLHELGDIAQTKIYSLFSGTGTFASGLSSVSLKIVNVTEALLDPAFGVDLSETHVQSFLRSTLPALIEAYLRRKTDR